MKKEIKDRMDTQVTNIKEQAEMFDFVVSTTEIYFNASATYDGSVQFMIDFGETVIYMVSNESTYGGGNIYVYIDKRTTEEARRLMDMTVQLDGTVTESYSNITDPETRRKLFNYVSTIIDGLTPKETAIETSVETVDEDVSNEGE